MFCNSCLQSVAMLETLRWKRKIRGPFLVIAPVSTLGHWQREVESLTDMNCVVYTGNQEDREIIRQHEFYLSESNSKALKFNVCSPRSSSLSHGNSRRKSSCLNLFILFFMFHKVGQRVFCSRIARLILW